MSAAPSTQGDESEIARELRECYANLTATQSRCNVMLEDCRALRREIAAFAPLSSVVADLGPDERRVLLVLARRLLEGQQTYGRLNVAGDGRDWRAERAAELADALVYGAIAEVAGASGEGRTGSAARVKD